jgi:hypothetical protein
MNGLGDADGRDAAADGVSENLTVAELTTYSEGSRKKINS